jgi:hypothetical protein
MAKKAYQIPFGLQGELIWKPSRRHTSTYSWENNRIFTDTLEFLNFKVERGTGCVYFKSLLSERQYHMSLHDFGEMVRRCLFQNNIIHGDFTFVKRGTSYFLIPILKDLNAP